MLPVTAAAALSPTVHWLLQFTVNLGYTTITVRYRPIYMLFILVIIVFSGANGDCHREIFIFPVQLTTSRIGNLPRLILSLAICDDHTVLPIHSNSTISQFTHKSLCPVSGVSCLRFTFLSYYGIFDGLLQSFSGEDGRYLSFLIHQQLGASVGGGPCNTPPPPASCLASFSFFFSWPVCCITKTLSTTKPPALNLPFIDLTVSTGGVQFVLCVVCFLPIHSGHQVRWTYQPGSHRRKVTQDFSSTFFLRCVLYFSREKDSAIPFPRRP